MGGAAGAFPSPQSSLFYNPAHLRHLKMQRTPITLIGVSLAYSSTLPNQYNFYQDEIKPLLDDGFDELSFAEEQALYDDIFRFAGETSQLNATLMLPSFVMNRGRYGLGGGLYFHTSAINKISDSGSGIPFVDFSGLADAIAVVSGATDLSPIGMEDFSIGLTTRFTQRYATVKSKPADVLAEDENLLIFKARTLDMDLGFLYTVRFRPRPSHLNVGLTWYNVFGSSFNYEDTGSSVTQNSPITERQIAFDQRYLQSRLQPLSSFRFGTAYIMPRLLPFLSETAVAFDVIGAPGSGLQRSFLTRICFGAQTSVNDWFFLRAGINQGYTTFGLGFKLLLVQIDYAYYGVEEGRIPGQLPSWRHRLQLVLGSY